MIRFLTVTGFLACVLVACGGTISGQNPGQNSDGGSSLPAACNACGSSEWCDRGGSCGTSGTCKTRPNACTDIYSPTCGCDGKIYGNPCSANAAGVDIDTGNHCTPPTGYIACGDKYCDAGISYCQKTGNDVAGPNQPQFFYACMTLTPACMTQKDCACFG